jgi:hypothetical protein
MAHGFVLFGQAKSLDVRRILLGQGCESTPQHLVEVRALALRAIEDDAECVDAWRFLGDWCLHLQIRSRNGFTNPPSSSSVSTAQQCFEKCLSLLALQPKPDRALLSHLTFSHGIALLQSGDPSACAEQVMQAYRLTPSDPVICFTLAKLRIGTHSAQSDGDDEMAGLEANMTKLRKAGGQLRSIYGLLRYAAGVASPVQSHVQIHLSRYCFASLLPYSCTHNCFSFPV